MTGNNAITFDIDWAPDWCIKGVAEELIEKNIKSTWFVTHDSPILKLFRDNNDLFELGIHPNFNDNSTQGKNPVEILNNLKSIVPEAISMRTHGLIQSSYLISLARNEFGILFDTSIFLNKSSGILPHRIYTSENNFIIKLPFYWEDDAELMDPFSNYNLDKYSEPGLKIFNFHPIHIALNSTDLKSYNECKNNNPEISKIKYNECLKYKSNSDGIEYFFKNLTDYMSKKKTFKISDIGYQWLELNNYKL